MAKDSPYAWNSSRVSKSPFKNLDTAKKAEAKYKKDKNSIGFTQKSSLKSMGRIPRSNGKYELGDKYKK